MRKLAALAVLGAGVLATGVAAAAPSTPSKPSTVNLKIVEWDFLPTTATKTAPAKIAFVVRNAGNLTHEFVVLKTVKSAGTLRRPEPPRLPRRVQWARSVRSSRAP